MINSSSSEIRVFGFVYVALLILLGVTVEAARWDLGHWNIAVTIVIATIKAGLIMMFFMHLNHRSALITLMAFASLFWLLLMLSLTFADYSTRHWL